METKEQTTAPAPAPASKTAPEKKPDPTTVIVDTLEWVVEMLSGGGNGTQVTAAAHLKALQELRPKAAEGKAESKPEGK